MEENFLVYYKQLAEQTLSSHTQEIIQFLKAEDLFDNQMSAQLQDEYQGLEAECIREWSQELKLPRLNLPSYQVSRDAGLQLLHQIAERLDIRTRPGMSWRDIFNACDAHLFHQIISNIDVNLANTYGNTLLFLAASHGHTETVKVLIGAGADVNLATTYGRTPLSWAAQEGRTEMARALIEAGADVNLANRYGDTPLSSAARYGHLDIVRLLLGAGAEVNLADRYGYTPLSWAAQYGRTEMARALLEAGAEVNLADGFPPLSGAAQNGHLAMVRLLLGAGAEVNLANNGNTPLFLAAGNGHAATVKELIEAGADVNLTNGNVDTPLISSAQNGHIEIVTALLQAGADVNLANRWGYTPLSGAVNNGHTETVKALLETGADVNLANRWGYTPLSGAVNNGHTEIVRLLKEEISSQKGLRASLYDDMRANDKEICERLARLHTIDLDDEEKGDHRLLFHMAKRGCIRAFDVLMEDSVPTPWEGAFNMIGDDINRRDEEGHTALYHAVKEGQVEMVKHILNKYQPDLTIKDNNYETLLNLANPLIQLELSRYKVNNPTLLAQALLLLSAGVGKQDDNHSNHPGY